MTQDSAQRKLQRHVVIVGMLIFVVGLIAASDTLHDKADALFVWAEGIVALSPRLGMAVFVLLAMLSAMAAFFSSAVFAPVAVLAWGKGVTSILLWLGWLLGGVASFCIGRFLGRRVAAMMIGEEKIAGWQNQLSRRTRFVHVLLFQAAVPSEIPGYVLGILRYRFSLYLVALALTELPYVIGVVFLGEFFLQGEAAVFIVLGILVIALGALLLRIRIRGKKE